VASSLSAVTVADSSSNKGEIEENSAEEGETVGPATNAPDGAGSESDE
jgi:hypothetical protein